MPDPILFAKGKTDCNLLPRMTNRHGLVAGATGTGKTVTLQALAEQLSKIGVPVFCADIKGDLSGISQPGSDANTHVTDRIKQLGLPALQYAGNPVTFWDVFGEQGHHARTTISDMGPLLLGRMLNLNDTQSGVLTAVFRIADDNGMLLLDLKDLRAMLQFAGDNAATYRTQYGNISTASIGAIQRGLLALEESGGDVVFGEPSLNLDDLLQTDANGHGVVNVLVADKLMQTPAVYTTFLLWLLSELFEQLPEIGDPDKPKLVFFFDEAHLLFDDAPKALLDKIEQVVRLIRSKGVGVYFVTQNPDDVPDNVLGQLGNRVQHALRAFTPRDQKAVRAAAETFRTNPDLDVETVITQLNVGEALVSTLDEKGAPTPVERAFVIPPASQVGAITVEQRRQIIGNSIVGDHYDNPVDRESAYEILKVKGEASAAQAAQDTAAAAAAKQRAAEEKEAARQQKAQDAAERAEARRARQSKSAGEKMVEAAATSAVRSIGSSLGRSLTRGLMGSLFGKK
jgi:DNA helicase HerA-like ATPase